MNQSGLRFPLLFIILFAFLTTAFAQFPTGSKLSPQLAVYGGYSGYKPGGKTSGIELGRLPNGWNSGADFQFTRRYSFLADYGHYANTKTGTTQTYLFGPRFTFHAKALSPFAEVMMGFQRIAANNQPTYTAFNEAFGGGLDVNLARRFSLRLFQADFIYAADHEKTQLNLNQFYGMRVSAGVVWNISKRRRPTVVAKNEPKIVPLEAAKSEPSTSATAEAPNAAEAPAQSSVASASSPVEGKPAEPKTEVASNTPAAESKKLESPVSPSVPSASSAVEENPAEPKTEAASSTPAAEEKKPESQSVPSASSAVNKFSAVQNVGTLRFPYEQYPNYLSPQDKRSLDAVASRLKLEPDATLAIVGSSPKWAGQNSAAQRAVNSKDYLIKKGIAADRIKAFARPPAKTKQPPAKTELIFVPAGQTYTAASATAVDEQHVKAEHIHVAHPEWREK